MLFNVEINVYILDEIRSKLTKKTTTLIYLEHKIHYHDVKNNYNNNVL